MELLPTMRRTSAATPCSPVALESGCRCAPKMAPQPWLGKRRPVPQGPWSRSPIGSSSGRPRAALSIGGSQHSGASVAVRGRLEAAQNGFWSLSSLRSHRAVPCRALRHRDPSDQSDRSDGTPGSEADLLCRTARPRLGLAAFSNREPVPIDWNAPGVNHVCVWSVPAAGRPSRARSAMVVTPSLLVPSSPCRWSCPPSRPMALSRYPRQRRCTIAAPHCPEPSRAGPA